MTGGNVLGAAPPRGSIGEDHAMNWRSVSGVRKAAIAALLGSTAVVVAVSAQAEDKFLLGLVSITATEDNNHRFIEAATKEAAKINWDVSVIDAQGNADQA